MRERDVREEDVRVSLIMPLSLEVYSEFLLLGNSPLTSSSSLSVLAGIAV